MIGKTNWDGMRWEDEKYGKGGGFSGGGENIDKIIGESRS